MKRFLSILSLVLLGFVSQSCYDDSALWESVNDLDSRVKTLETLCKEMNTNLASLQTLVSAMKQGDYIVDVAPLTENGVEVGYQITFYDRGTVNIYHGKDGVSSGDVPDFGAKQDTDGKYYWTVNGEWILDDNGNKLPVSTAEGVAGVTPKLKVENGKWYVSYDEGKTWEEAGSAVSEDANACLFKDVQLTDEALVLTMSDGSVFTLPIGERFRIVFGEFDASTIQYGTDVVIPYTIEGAKGEVSVFVVSDGWMFETELVEETAVSGKLTIRQEDYYDEEISGKVAVFAVAEDGTTVSKVIRLLSGVLRPSSDRYDDVYTVESSASQLEFTISTNRDFEVTTNADWITYANTKAVEEKTLVFDIQENENARRKTYVEIASGDIDFGFTVAQKGFSDAFSINVSCDEVRGGGWNVSIDTLFNKAGQTIYEVLGYSSWEELAVAAGGWDAVYNRTGEVILTAYDLYTGEALPYDEQYRNSLGFIHDSDGYLVSDWSLCKTVWNWSMIWDDTGSHLDKFFWFNTNKVYAGESNSFGILFTAPEGEARIEVTVNITEYIDPEKGLYDNPAAPGRYEFTLHDKVDLDSLSRVFGMSVLNREMAEILKSTLGMTTYEISQVAGWMGREYQLNNGDRWDGFSDIRLDVNGHVTDWNRNTMVAIVNWIFGALADGMHANIYIPIEDSGDGPTFFPALYRAIGKTVSYKYVIRYEGYELIFTHEIEFVGENPYELYCLAGKDGQKVWRYAPDQTYGVAGNSGNGFGYENGNVDGMWWSTAPSDLINQLDQAGGVAYGDESPNAYMIFTDEGVVTTYTPSGAKVRSGMYEVNDYNPSRPDGWELGKLMTSEPALLFPWSMNEGGLGVTEYDIMDLTPEQMTLVYTKGNGSGSWGEITFWRFVSGEISEDVEQPGENPAIGAEGNHILVEASEMAEAAWDTQFWITFADAFEEGDTWEISMAVKADEEASSGTQTHQGTGGYLHWAAIGTVPFTTEWTLYTASGTASAEMVGGDAIAFNLNDYAPANKYYFDNISFKVNGVEQIVNGDLSDPYTNKNFFMKQYDKNNGGVVPAHIVNTSGSTGYALTMTNDTVRDANWSVQCWYQLDEPLKANTDYEFKYVAKATSQYNWCSIFLQSSTTDDMNFNHGLPFSTEWTANTLIINAGDVAAFDKLVFNLGDFVGTLYLDNVSLKEVGSDLELISNGDFETGTTDGWSSWTNVQGLGEGYTGGAAAVIEYIYVSQNPSAITYVVYDHSVKFNPEGLQVRAKYSDGTSAVLDNSLLTFSDVYPDAQTVDVLYENFLTQVEVNVVQGVGTVGVPDFSNLWWTTFSDDYVVGPGESKVWKMMCYAPSGCNNWNSPCTILRRADMTEYAVCRMDNYGWGAGYEGNENLVLESNWNWDTFASGINMSTIVLTVTNNGDNTADIRYDVTYANGEEHYQTYSGINVDSSDLQTAIVTEVSYLVLY